MSASVQYINTEQWSNLFQVSPSQFNVTCELQKEEFLKLSIINSCNDRIAWKLKTNRPGRYMVSPKQGIILAKQHKDCTVVLSKLKQVPDTKKPDKFLIQATKVDPQTQGCHLPLLWKDRESKHDKKRHVYAYQSVTIKCFLNIDIKQKQTQSKKPIANIIEDYVASSNSNTQDIPNIINPTPIQTIHTIENMDTKTEITTIDNNNDTMQTQTKTKTQETVVSIDADITSTTQEQPTATDSSPYNAKTVEGWRKKALEYDELFQFTRKTLAQRDELSVRWKTEETKTRSLEKLNRQLNEEKKHILNQYNRYRNTHVQDEDEDKYDDDDDEDDDEDEKREILNDEMDDKIKEEKEKNAVIQEMNEIEQNAVRNSRSGFTISIIHILITILLMYVAFMVGKQNIFNLNDGNNDNDHVVDDTIHKHEV